MKCPKCEQKLRVSQKDPNYGLCDDCKLKIKLELIEDGYEDFFEIPQQISEPKQRYGMTCTKCKSSNVLIQREQTGSIGGSTHSFSNKGSHGLLYWVFIGWWLAPLWWMLKLCMTGGLSLFFKKKDKITGKTITASKTLSKTVAVCQDCGYHWGV